MTTDRELADLRDALLRRLCVDLRPDHVHDEFERHQLLAIRIHHASRLNARPGQGERAGWKRYFAEHWPRGDEKQALLLWEHWRCPLVKDECPGPGVAISAGQPHGHWKVVEPRGMLYLNLESLWDDFKQSVESFMLLLADDPERRRVALERQAKRRYTVQSVTIAEASAGMFVTGFVPVASASASASALKQEPRSICRPPSK